MKFTQTLVSVARSFFTDFYSSKFLQGIYLRKCALPDCRAEVESRNSALRPRRDETLEYRDPDETRDLLF